MIIFKVTPERKRCYVVGAYVPPNDLPAVYHMTHYLTCGTEGVVKLLVGELNAFLEHPRYQQEEHLATVVAIHGLKNQAQHFTPRRRY